jgi:hypothetical protein
MLSKKKRNTVYKLALKNYKNRDRFVSGICFELNRAMGELMDTKFYQFHNGYELESYWPGIYKHKPESKEEGDHWFPFEDLESRIKILESAIKETE